MFVPRFVCTRSRTMLPGFSGDKVLKQLKFTPYCLCTRYATLLKRAGDIRGVLAVDRSVQNGPTSVTVVQHSERPFNVPLMKSERPGPLFSPSEDSQRN